MSNNFTEKRIMKHYWLLILALSFTIIVQAQTEEIEEIKAAIAEAESAKEKMILRYELAEVYLRVDAEEAESIGKIAYKSAKDQGNHGMAARSALLVAQAFERQRDTRNQEVWLRTTLNHAKRAGDSDLIIRSVDKRSRLAVKDRNYRRAYEINQEAFTYFSKDGSSISELEGKYDALRGQIEREKRSLQQEKDQLEFEIRNLRLETNQLSTDKGVLQKETVRLTQDNKQKEEEKEIAEQQARQRAREVDNLSEEVAKARLISTEKEKTLIEKEKALVEAELATTKAKEKAQAQEFFLYGTAGAAGILFLLALLLYSRFRAKRKAAKSLKSQNEQIEEERKRSDELLLNILPASIAAELKEKGKAQARQYGEATVLFSDFINFTSIAEQLTPDELVQELDVCFKAFDFIIEKYEDIEKIKTIGDAYMCASGLGERKTLPDNLIRAALEMQAFLEEHKQERQRLNKPFFEARIGLHTGPVVAGVVGVKKFAYDIWGDTVNIAARVESNSEAGRVNISETTYRLIKYSFDCLYRGKVEAKNKGLIDMYFVQNEKVEQIAG